MLRRFVSLNLPNENKFFKEKPDVFDDFDALELPLEARDDDDRSARSEVLVVRSIRCSTTGFSSTVFIVFVTLVTVLDVFVSSFLSKKLLKSTVFDVEAVICEPLSGVLVDTIGVSACGVGLY